MYFFRKYKERMIVILIAIILLVVIGYTSVERVNLTGPERFIGNLLSPISKVTVSAKHKVTGLFSYVGSIFSAMEENESLKDEIIRLEIEKRELENIIGRSDFLRNEQNLLNVSDKNLLRAKIIGKEPGNWYDNFIIDKGSKDGINKGDTIIQGIEVQNQLYVEALIGRVIDVGDNWAKVVSIIDEWNSVSFKIIRTQDGGVISGSIDSKLEGYLFDYSADVISGDQLYTSGLGGVYLNDIYIGEVDEVITSQEELSKSITVKPAINFKKLYNVFVIVE